MNGTSINPMGIATIAAIPNSLLGTMRRIWKTGYRYHSGRISSGVAKGLAGSPAIAGSRTAKPTHRANVPRITTGKMYSSSLGQAGSP